MEEDNDYSKLPIEERCQHKLWKARVCGYEAATKLFQQISDEKNAEWAKYLGLIKKFVLDSNVVAQEKGLEAVLVYVENAGCASKTAGEVVSGIVNKCLGAPKAKTKEKAIGIIMMYIEIEKQEIVQDELMKGFSNKNPKVVAACIQTLREALRNFGPKVITLKAVIKQIPILLEDRDKGIRDEAKLLTIEVYRWIGAALKPQLASLKPVQLTEFEAEFEKLGTSKAMPMRYLRSQQHLQSKIQQEASEEDIADEDGEEEEEKEEIDPYELLEPVNILSKFPSDFYEKCEAKKWQERKEAMDALMQLTSNPKLEQGDYGELIRTLKKIISKDSNVVVVGIAGKCLAGLANGLKNKFHPYAGQCIPVILEKFKEKKQNVVQALREAIDAIYPSTTLEAIQEDILAALENKNPTVKAETTAFVARCFSHCSPEILHKKLLKTLSAALVKTLNDTDPVVRDNSAEALGTAMKVVSEKAMLPFVQEIDAIKMTKVKECCEKAVITLPKTSGSKKKSVQVSSQKKVSSEPVANVLEKRPTVKSKGSQKAVSATNKKPGIRGGQLRAGGGGAPRTNNASPSQQEMTEKELSLEEVEETITSFIPTNVYNDLIDNTWKTRLSAMTQLTAVIKSLDKPSVPTQAVIQAIARKPGFKDTNVQVLKLKLDLITYLALECSFSRCSAQLCVLELADKLGDPKNGSLSAEALSAIAEATKLDYVCNQVFETAFAQKNPKTHAEAMNWLANAIKEFGLQIQVKSLLDYIKKALAATNPTVRSSAVNLLGVMYLYIGPSLRVFFENEKAALLQQIDAEFEKLQGVPPPEPTRGVGLNSDPTENSADDDGGAGDGVSNVINIADLIPRSDICNSITPELLENIADKNWKIRGEALQRLATIISEAKFITPNLGNLPPLLKIRLTDLNKNLAIQALNICQAIGTAMGPNCVKHVRTLGPGILVSLGDNKPMVRSAALVCLNAWIEQCGVGPFIEGEMLLDALKLENPVLRTELLSWLSDKLPQVKAVSPDLALCTPNLFSCLEDRNSDVRKKAGDAVLPFMIHLGYDNMFQATKKLKPGSRNAIVGILDKAKLNLPVKASKQRTALNSKGSQQNSAAALNRSEEDLEKISSGNKNNLNNASKNAKNAISKNKAPNAGKASSGKKTDDDDQTPLLQINNLKEQRILDEQKLKVLKWNFTAPRDEFYEQLKDQMTVAGFNRGLQANLFHNDFKFHIKAIDSFMECLVSPEPTIANLDLILKWLALKFFDTNPSVLLKGLEYLKQLFIKLNETEYQLLEHEASLFIPYLILKVGDPKDAVRQLVKNIFKLIRNIYPASKLFLYLMEGLKSKNARQRTECLDLLGNLIEVFGVSVCNPSAPIALKEITKHISDRDNSVRNAALNCIIQAYFLEGEKIYKHLGPIPDKEMCLLEERIKRSSRNRVAPAKAGSPTSSQNGSPNTKQIQSTQADTQKKDLKEIDTTTMKRNAGNVQPPSSRPVSGMFTLDLDKIEEMMDEKSDSQLPKLVKPDLDEILSEPIKLPETRMRPPSPATKLLSNSADIASAMDLVISQIASNDTNMAVNALAQIDEFLKDEVRANMMISRVDQLILAESLQYRMVYTRHVDDVINKKQILKLYRCLTMTLVTLFRNESLAKKASTDVLRDLLYNLIAVLLDDRLTTLDEGPQVVRSLNVLIIKMVERANCTNILCAVTKLLHDCVGSETCSSKFIDVVVKCHWKILRALPDIIDELSLEHVLLEIHIFLKAFPSITWKQRPSDIPLRTIKTILHSLVEHSGNKIMSYLGLIDNLQESEMEAYLQKVLKKNSSKHHRTSENQSPGRIHSGKRDGKNQHRLSKNTHEMLAEIFKKIGSKDYTKEGLADLYNFKKCYPEADIEPFLRKSSQFFQNYIERGLKTIENERSGSPTINIAVMNTSTNSNTSVNENISMPSADGVVTNTTTTVTTKMMSGVYAPNSQESEFCPSMYMERLKMLRAKCGYDDPQFDNNPMTVKSATPPEPLTSAAETKRETQISLQGMPRSESSDAVSGLSRCPMNVDDLRQRLERIKNSTKT